MDIQELRKEIDAIDDELVRLFVRRMGVSAQIADYKKANHLPILVPAREREILKDVSQKAGPEMSDYARVLYSMIFELSRSYQSKRNDISTPLHQQILQAIENTNRLFPQNARV